MLVLIYYTRFSSRDLQGFNYMHSAPSLSGCRGVAPCSTLLCQGWNFGQAPVTTGP